MADQTTTETPTTPTEGTTSEAAVTTLLTSTEATTTPAAASETTPEGGKPTEEAKPAEETKPAEEAKPAGAPESYDFKAPEGKAFDPAVLEPFAAAAKEANLTQDAAQKLLDKMAPALADRQAEQVKAVQTGWADASKSDKEFGGDKLKENLATAKQALDAHGTPEFRKLLDDTGLGNHPEVIRMLVRVGKTLGEDKFVSGGPTKGPADIAARLYPTTLSKE